MPDMTLFEKMVEAGSREVDPEVWALYSPDTSSGMMRRSSMYRQERALRAALTVLIEAWGNQYYASQLIRALLDEGKK